MSQKSAIEETFAVHVRCEKMQEPEREYRFAPPRRFRFDFAWPELRIAVECEGGVWSGGRHVRGKGFESDCEKYNLAAELGWRVFRFTGNQVQKGAAIKQMVAVLRAADNGEL